MRSSKRRSSVRVVSIVGLAALAATGPAATQDAPAPTPPPAAERHEGDAAVEKELDGKRVRLNFPDTPLWEVVELLRDMLPVPVVVQGSVDRDASVVARIDKEQPLRAALKAVAGAVGLEARVWRGYLVLCPPGKKLPQPPEVRGDDETARKLRDAEVSMGMEDLPLGEALEFLVDVTELRLRATPEVAGRVLDLRVERLPLASVLDGVAVATDTVWRVRGGEIVFEPAP
ncbi:MAG: hypothetical protein KF878_11065 [Planctomycetes bacterium]|nr:hypothetical protein [Planctomycetota bacterium]